MNKLFILTFKLLVISIPLYAQKEATSIAQEEEEVTICTQNLRLARSLYEEGKLNEIPSTLNSCLKSGFTPEEKIEAYRLIAITYLYLDEPAKADEAMLNLLQTDPEYIINENLDPAEYINLYRSFRTKWLFRWGVKGGGVYSIPHVMMSYTSSNPGQYNGGLGFQFGFLAEFDELLPYGIKLQPELYYTNRNFSYENVPTDGEIQDANSSINTTMSLSYLELYITAKYYVWPDKPYYATLSPGVGYLLSANVSSYELNGQERPGMNLSEDAPGLMTTINPQLFAGAGTEFKMGRFYANLELRYGYSFINLISERHTNPEATRELGFIDSDFKLNSLNFSITFMRASYKPKKLID